jgi:hypothetical protein
MRVLDTTFPVTQLLPSDQQAVDQTISEPTLTYALDYATHMHNMWRVNQSKIKAATTTTTTIAKTATG